MADDNFTARNLGEIGHLFLSNVRNNNGGGRSAPTRTPPKRTDVSVDITPEEFNEIALEPTDLEHAPRRVPTSVILAGHLGGDPIAQVHQLAGQLCLTGKRVGLLCLDSQQADLMVFDREYVDEAPGATVEQLPSDARSLSQALDELAWDVDHWLVYSSAYRSNECRSLLSAVRDWSLISTCDHDGIVSAYRVLKGLSALPQPSIQLACISSGPNESATARERIDQVCQQFLNWTISDQIELMRNSVPSGHRVLSATGSEQDLWSAAVNFFAPSTASKQEPVKVGQAVTERSEPGLSLSKSVAAPRTAVTPVYKEVPSMKSTTIAQPSTAPVAAPQLKLTDSDFPTVMELDNNTLNASSMSQALMQHLGGFSPCGINPPMHADCVLAVCNARLSLLAAVQDGLADLRQISKAYAWLLENRNLLAMALPQLAIDLTQIPTLELLVNQNDLSADLLQPMLASPCVTVHTARPIRWGQRLGLLLNAA